jgi:hemerythrin-like domain-containing protein
MPINRWALLEEYFRWYQAGLIDDIAMLAETDVRGKENIIERKSLYSQLQSQVAQLEEQVKDKEGTVETLSRQLVQAGIRHNVQTGSMETKKDVLETEAQQKYYRKLINDDMKKNLHDKKQEE